MTKIVNQLRSALTGSIPEDLRFSECRQAIVDRSYYLRRSETALVRLGLESGLGAIIR